ncbi:hypothetical protein [Sphingomonas sp. STIS6.2]|uniref:hypothetical protein n=1 Tax=Sphingomonas sp. STIS6.2 TaxID=1379700 RepID=UPI00131B9E94|nr:hypothetical protein [Sphingomonas sp. STIS6.2]
MEQNRSIETVRARLTAIRSALEELLCAADEAGEYLLGAKLADSQMCVVIRLSALGMDKR